VPLLEDASRMAPRSPAELAGRAVALTLVGLEAEGFDQLAVAAWVDKKAAAPFLSPAEQRFVSDPNRSPADRIQFTWRYEGLDVVLWALGFKPGLAPFNQMSDVKTDLAIVKANRLAGLSANAKPRTVAELLDMADLYTCLHKVTIELRLKGLRAAQLNEEIIAERHYALNWLVRHRHQDWDDVTTDT
jgi:hypothetical protein